ncbi:MAG: PIG-L family deacetylase [Burkholderiales bacterium]|nr:PIG-L family deacetylase [Burkholderiales bacterium]
MNRQRESVLVVAAHPDDEVLGCGGAMAFHADRGDDVRVIIVAQGEVSRLDAPSVASQGTSDALADAARAASAVLGVSDVTLLGLPDNQLDALPLLQVVKPIERIVAQYRPSIVYTHHFGDLNVDHRVVHGAVLTACRPLPGSSVRVIRCFEVPSSTEWNTPSGSLAFAPNCHMDVSLQLSRKLDALREYPMEMRPFPHARSYEAVEALARWRGASVGLDAAEAFMSVREIVS